jgi:hypothetical protein
MLELQQNFPTNGGVREMKEEEIIEQAKRWLRARAGTIELKEHLISILQEKFQNPEEVLALLLKKGLAKEEWKMD